MQVKKFEAPTLQEALDQVKKELGPEAIILQTRKGRRGFGLLSKPMVELTVAVSDRSQQKRQAVDRRMTDETRKLVRTLPAEKQAEIIDKYSSQASFAQGGLSLDTGVGQRKITATRYIDIEDSPTAGEAPKRKFWTGKPAVQATAYGKAQGGLQNEVHSEGASESDHSHLNFASQVAQVQDRVQVRSSGAAQTQATRAYDAPQSAQTAASLSHSSSHLSSHSSAHSSSLEAEMAQLKRRIEELSQDRQVSKDSSGDYFGMKSPLLQDAFDQLVVHGMDRRFAFVLAKKAAFEVGESGPVSSDRLLDGLAKEIMESLRVASFFENSPQGGQTKDQGGRPRIVALVGPTGVGKSTTAAKIASEALLKRGLKVGLVNLDFQKVGAFDQLATYAKVLGIPFRSALSAEDFRSAVADFHRMDLILVDTGGCSRKEEASSKKTSDVLREFPEIESYVVLSAITREAEQLDVLGRLHGSQPKGLIISKLDEATLYGPIYNLVQKVKLPLVYFTVGTRVPEDLEPASAERVASLLVEV